MNLSELPLELIDEILKHLDAISLAKSRQVCNLWRSLHDQPKFKFLWKRLCIEGIPRDVLIELTGIKALFAEEDTCRDNDKEKNGKRWEIGIEWKDIYQEWYRSRHIGKWPCMINELTGHRGPVWDAKFSGDKVVTCGEDCTIRVWDSWTKHCLSILSGHLAGVLSISLRKTPDSLPHAQVPHDLIVSGSKDNYVKVWSLKNPGVCLFTLYGHTLCVNCVAVEGDIAASASDDCSVKIWDINKGVCLHTLSNLGDWAKYVSVWRDAVLSVTDNSCLGLWSVDNAESLSSIKLLDTRVHSSLPPTPGVQGAVLRGQSSLVITHSDGLFIWEQKTSADGSVCGGVVYNFSLIGQHTNNVQRGECLAMRGALVAIGTRSGSVCVYHLNGNWENQFKAVHCVLQVSKASVNAVSLDDDGEGPSLLTAGDDGIVRVYRWFPPSTLQDS